jgi:hypothetical protein
LSATCGIADRNTSNPANPGKYLPANHAVALLASLLAHSLLNSTPTGVFGAMRDKFSNRFFSQEFIQ